MSDYLVSAIGRRINGLRDWHRFGVREMSGGGRISNSGHLAPLGTKNSQKSSS
jgi:hypothetical protein